jgi:hypothetical protein
MPISSETPGSHMNDWLLAIGGTVGLALGAVALATGRQPLAQRGAVLLIGGCFLLLGTAGLLQERWPTLAGRLKFAGKVLAGFGIFSASWALSHP